MFLVFFFFSYCLTVNATGYLIIELRFFLAVDPCCLRVRDVFLFNFLNRVLSSAPTVSAHLSFVRIDDLTDDRVHSRSTIVNSGTRQSPGRLNTASCFNGITLFVWLRRWKRRKRRIRTRATFGCGRKFPERRARGDDTRIEQSGGSIIRPLWDNDACFCARIRQFEMPISFLASVIAGKIRQGTVNNTGDAYKRSALTRIIFSNRIHNTNSGLVLSLTKLIRP